MKISTKFIMSVFQKELKDMIVEKSVSSELLTSTKFLKMKVNRNKWWIGISLAIASISKEKKV